LAAHALLHRATLGPKGLTRWKHQEFDQQLIAAAADGRAAAVSLGNSRFKTFNIEHTLT